MCEEEGLSPGNEKLVTSLLVHVWAPTRRVTVTERFPVDAGTRKPTRQTSEGQG